MARASTPPASLARRVLLRAGAVLLGLVAAALPAEVLFRLHAPRLVRLAGEERAYTENLTEGRARHILTQDDELGYRPVLGGDAYAEHGARWNDHALEKPAGTRRVLFVGDSVTFRGTLVEAIRHEFGDEGVEYWNAGVEGYSTPQELGYYERFLGDVDADHVVLTFHLNDFETTPLTFVDGDGRVRIYYARRPLAELNPWLLRHSYLYRFLVGATIRHTAPYGFEEDVEREVTDALVGFARLTRERGARFTVLVLPYLTNVRLHGLHWPAEIGRRYETILERLDELGIEHYDLLPALEAAHAAAAASGERIDVQETPEDTDHPSRAFGSFAAEHLRARGFRP